MKVENGSVETLIERSILIPSNMAVELHSFHLLGEYAITYTVVITPVKMPIRRYLNDRAISMSHFDKIYECESSKGLALKQKIPHTHYCVVSRKLDIGDDILLEFTLFFTPLTFQIKCKMFASIWMAKKCM